MFKEAPLAILCNTSSFLSERMGRLPVSRLKFETDGQIKGVWAYSLPFFQFVRQQSDMEVNGALPENGAGLVIGNHISSLDPFWAYYLVAETAHRTMRAWAKRSLLDPSYKETAAADVNRTHCDKAGGLIKRFVVAPYVRSFDLIPATIGGHNVVSIKQTRKAFDHDQLVWMFPQGHRRPPGDLLSFLPGAAFIVLDRPDLPIYPVGFSGTDKGIFAPKTINIGKPFTKNQIEREVPEMATMTPAEKIERTGLYMVDKIAELVVDEAHKAAWHNGRSLMNQFGLGRERLLRRVGLDSDLSRTRQLFEEVYPYSSLSPEEFIEQIAA